MVLSEEISTLPSAQEETVHLPESLPCSSSVKVKYV